MNLKIGDRIYSIHNGKNDYRFIHSVVDNDKYYLRYRDGSISLMPFDKKMIENWFRLDNSTKIREKLGIK